MSGKYDLLYTGTEDYRAESEAPQAVIQAEYSSAFESAGLRARVVAFMPSRDRVIGTKPR